MRNFVNPRQNNRYGALPAIAAAMNGAPHESRGISPYHALYGYPGRYSILSRDSPAKYQLWTIY